jgi:hypothetical protein
MPIGSLIAGALIYFALYESVEEHLDIKVNKNIFFVAFVLITLVLGVYITDIIQTNEAAGQNSNGQQHVGIYTCITEDVGTCNSIVNKMNNDNYSAYTAAASTSSPIPTLNLYIGLSLTDAIIKNVFTYFCIGILFIWSGVSLYSLRKVEA